MPRVFSLIFLTITSVALFFFLMVPEQRHVGIIEVLLPFPNPRNAFDANATMCRPIVVRVDSNRNWWINQDQVPHAKLKSVIAEIMETRAERVVYFHGDSAIQYQDAIDALDAVNATRDIKLVLLTARTEHSREVFWDLPRVHEAGPSLPSLPVPRPLQ